MRILVADDDVRLADLLAESLADAGWETAVVHDGRSAYDLLTADVDPAVDVAIVDWALPGLDGGRVTRGVRGRGLTVPILILTAHVGASVRANAFEAGADDYVSKPFDLADLLDRLEALAARRGRRSLLPHPGVD